jgi:RimJ/RimL family protein N-acetyltransferase
VSADHPVLTTERLRLRRYRREDLEALVPVLGDPGSMRYYPHPFSRDECAAWIEWQLQHYATDGFALWAIELRETGEFVGDCGPAVRTVDGIREVEVGWHVHPEHQNHGIATEAGLACRDYVFQTLGLTRLISLVRPENIPSCRVAEKIGMRVEKVTPYGSEGWLHRVYVAGAA